MAYKTAPEMFGDGGGFGPVVPYSTSNPPGTSAGNRGIQFGEQLTAAVANRTHYALALNTDDLNTRLAAFEVGGLDAAYDNGTIGPAGGGRQITKDGGAVETASTLVTQYADDIANAHFRADAFGDTAKGGGYDFRAQLAANGYGYLSRTTFSPSVTYTAVGASSAVTMNPGGAGTDIARFAAAVQDGSGNTDVGYRVADFLEITGTPFDGLYVIWAGGPLVTDWRVRKLDGTLPGFAANQAGTARFFTADMYTSSRAWLGTGAPLVVSGTSADESVILAASRDLEGKAGVGTRFGMSFGGRLPNGQITIPTRITGLGRIQSDLSPDTFVGTPFAREIDWEEGGIPFIRLLKNASPVGYHEIGLLIEDGRDTFVDAESWTCVEYRHPIIESTLLGLNASINGTFAAPMGKIILPDSDGAPAPPAGQFHTLWAMAIQPGATVLRILTGTGSGRDYLVQSVTTDSSAPASQDYVTVTHLDGSALDPGELPVAGVLTFQFLLRGPIGGRSHPLAIDSAAPGVSSPPTDITPAALFHATATSGDPSGSMAAAFRGGLVGLVTVDPLITVPGLYTLSGHIAWMLTGDGDFSTNGDVQANSLQIDSGYSVAMTNFVDRTINRDLRVAQSEEDGAGVPYWRFDRANGWWECIGTNGVDAAIYFPIDFTGQLRTTTIQVWESTLLEFVYGALQVTTPVWGTPSSAPGVVNANETLFAGSPGTPWGEIVISHGGGLGTNIAIATSNYAIRVRCTQVGARIRALRHVVRFTSIGPGGIGG